MLSEFADIKKEEEIAETYEVRKPLSFFDYLQDINFGKKGNIHLERDPELKQFNTFMILRYLSLEPAFCSLVNIFNAYQVSLTKQEMYKALLILIPRGNRFLRYPKTNKDEIEESDVNLVKKYFECSFNEAKELIKLKLISHYDIEKIKEAYGGKADKKGKLK
jgi:hypothetical protein